MSQLLRAELQPGEGIEWCAQPRPAALLVKALPVFGIGIPVCGFLAMFLCNMIIPGWKNSSPGIMFPLLAILSPFFAAGLACILHPLWALWVASRTVYAITDRRCLMIEMPFRRHRIRSYLAGPGSGNIVNLRRVEDRRGRGDLIFHTEVRPARRGDSRTDVGFLGIWEVQAVEMRVRLLIGKKPWPDSSPVMVGEGIETDKI